MSWLPTIVYCVLDTTLYDRTFQKWLTKSPCFSGDAVSSTCKVDCQNIITELLSKMLLTSQYPNAIQKKMLLGIALTECRHIQQNTCNRPPVLKITIFILWRQFSFYCLIYLTHLSGSICISEKEDLSYFVQSFINLHVLSFSNIQRKYYTIAALERDQYEVLWSRVQQYWTRRSVVIVLLHKALFYYNYEIFENLEILGKFWKFI